MMFGEVVGLVGRAGSPVDMELLLVNSILDPVESHVHCFGLLLSNLFVGESDSGSVIDLYWCRGLCVSHFFERVAKGDRQLCVVEQCPRFCFSC